MARTPESARTSSVDAVIVGGGMVGLPLAVALAKSGLEVAVVDRADPLAWWDQGFDGRVSAIALGTRRILEALELWPAMARAAEPILDIRVTDADAPAFLHFDHEEMGEGPLGHIIENRLIRGALVDAAARTRGLELVAPAEIAAIGREPGFATVTLGDGHTLSARLLIGADGRESLVRKHAGIKVTEWRYPQTAIVTTVVHERPHQGVAEERFLPAGPFAILPMTDDAEGAHRSSIVWTEDKEKAPSYLALDDDAFDEALAARFGDHLGAVRAVGPRFSYPLGLMLAEATIADRLALVGDAAHVIHPIAGQGLNLGLRDVAALAEVVVDAARLGLDIGALTVLEDYQSWRRFDNFCLAGATDVLNRLFSTDFAPLRAARAIGLAAANRIGPARRFFMAEAMGLTGELPRLAQGRPL